MDGFILVASIVWKDFNSSVKQQQITCYFSFYRCLLYIQHRCEVAVQSFDDTIKQNLLKQQIFVYMCCLYLCSSIIRESLTIINKLMN
eukprot:m.52824 g.52824  ORF g.52824 m.52824 type:complete len:88 (-) comp11016_c0_seq3:1997-2260(-)